MTALVAAGIVIAVALAPPLHGAAEELFSAHMVQHLLLVSVAAPLLAAGLRAPVLLLHLPRSARRPAGRWLRAGGTGIAAVWVVHVLTLWAWHAPALYESALRRPALHALEHASLLVTATAFWAMVLHAGERRGRDVGAALLALFAAAGQSTALGALLTLTTEPSYPGHAVTAARWGLTPLEDQHLAGLVMWVIGGLGYLIAALVVLARTLRREKMFRAGAMAVLVAILCGVLAGCDGATRAPRPATDGNPERGRQAMERYGCGACHHIPGVHGARGIVGPSLAGLGARPYIAGRLPNTAWNLMAWIRGPRALDPQTIMPDLAVSERDARDIAAFLTW